MASERQVAANRRNARKSTGPRTTSGKQRASRNACRHGLGSRRATMLLHAGEIDDLAARIAGISPSPAVMTWARLAAEAELDLVRVRRARAALIDHVTRPGRSPAPPRIGSLAEVRLLRRWLQRGEAPSTPTPSRDARAPVPPDACGEPSSARRLLPDLMILARCEQRAWWRRERALRTLRGNDVLLR